MHRPEINFIEDPAVAAAIADLKSRWPAVGEAADHPLTEFFVRRWRVVERRVLWEDCKKLSCIALLMAGLWLGFHFTPFQFHFLIWIAVVCAFYLWEKTKRLVKTRDIYSPFHLMTAGGDKSQMEQLWLTPVRFRDYAGIYLGWVYCSRSSSSAKYLNNLVVSVIALFLVYLTGRVFKTFSIPAGHAVAVWACILIVCVSVYYFLRDPVFLLKNRLHDIKVADIDTRAATGSWLRQKGNAQWAGTMLILLFWVFYLWNMFQPIMGGWIWIFLEIMLVALSVGIYLWGRFNKPDLDREFAFFVKDETPEYDRKVSRLIGRNTDVNLECRVGMDGRSNR
ncbi:hypothetical protein LLG95_00525 [bacterium]|nr:hypothetical protein [bacterium]